MATNRPDGTVLKRHVVPQDKETVLTTHQTPFGTALYLYARSADSVAAETVGQDYITFQYNNSNLSFAVCDGVGQSFMGDLAARLLGDALIDWLWEIERPESDEAFSEQVGEALDDFTKDTAEQVAEFALPPELPPIVKQALEMQRDYGSEAMFVAARVCLDAAVPWIAICWLGDAPVAAIDIDGRLMDLGPKGGTAERWNATTGAKGTVHTWVGDAKHVARVAGYTDGLGVEKVPTDEDLAKMMQNWLTSPPIDDAALFDIRVSPSPETVGDSDPAEESRVIEPSPIESVLMLPSRASPSREDAPSKDPARPEDTPGDAGDSSTQPGVRLPDDTRPIDMNQLPKQVDPVAQMDPLPPPPPNSPAVAGWSPLFPAADPLIPEPAEMPEIDPRVLEEMKLSTQQQIQLWRQAVLEGLTNARLAMVMIERLLDELENQLGDDIPDGTA
ncbi:MAG: protein phosphatase 2C domain-containing protein [Chloroflexi bacterium]|nr:protein phosphatase 2C domain-containing protein [Chloroflexota bacterium]